MIMIKRDLRPRPRALQYDRVMQRPRLSASSRTPPQRPAGLPTNRRVTVAAAAAVVLIAAFLLLRPSPYSNVRNLDSRGTSIIAFGDSLTAGYGAAPGEDYPSRLANLIGSPLINAGVSGDTTEAALARIDADVLSRDPRIVIVGLGGNDFLQRIPIGTTGTNLRSIVRAIQAKGAMVVLLGFSFPSLGDDYASMYERIAKDERCLLIGGVLRGILTDESLKSDAIHPNARGYELMAERIAGPVKKLMAKAEKERRER